MMRFATWLLETTRVPDAEVIAGDLWEELQQHVLPARGRIRATCWYASQVVRSLAPLYYRSWERASVTRASIAIVAAAIASTTPAAVLLTLRSFVLSQVPLKTTAEPSAMFAALLVAIAFVSVIAGLALATRVLHASRD